MEPESTTCYLMLLLKFSQIKPETICLKYYDLVKSTNWSLRKGGCSYHNDI